MYERTYHAKVLKQSELPKQKRPFNWKRFLTILGVLFVIGGSIFIIRLPELQVQHIEVTGTNAEDPNQISSFIEKEIQGSYVFILPRKSMLLVPTSILTKKIAAAFPRFASVDVRRKGIHNLLVTVEEHTGTYLWCEHEESCYFMNKDGVVFAHAATFSGNAYIKLFGGDKKELPFTPLSDTERSLVDLFTKRLSSIDINAAAFHFVSEHEVDVNYLHHGRMVKLIFDPTNNLDESLQALYTAFKTESFTTKYKSSERVLEYVDLRFPNKVVYKFL